MPTQPTQSIEGVFDRVLDSEGDVIGATDSSGNFHPEAITRAVGMLPIKTIEEEIAELREPVPDDLRDDDTPPDEGLCEVIMPPGSVSLSEVVGDRPADLSESADDLESRAATALYLEGLRRRIEAEQEAAVRAAGEPLFF